MSFAFPRGDKSVKRVSVLPAAAAFGLCCMWICTAVVLFQQLPPLCTSVCLHADHPVLFHPSHPSSDASSPSWQSESQNDALKSITAARLSMQASASLSTTLFDQLSNNKEQIQYQSESLINGVNANTFTFPSAGAASDSAACPRRCSLDSLKARINHYWINFLQTAQQFTNSNSELNPEFPEPAGLISMSFTVPPAALGSSNRHARRLLTSAETAQAEATAIMILYPLLYGLGFLCSLCAWGPFCSMWVDNNCLRDKVALQTKWRPRGGKCDIPEIPQEPIGIRYPPAMTPKLKRYGGFQSPPTNNGDQYTMQVAPMPSPYPPAAAAAYPVAAAAPSHAPAPAWSNVQNPTAGPTFVNPSTHYNFPAPTPSYPAVVSATSVSTTASPSPSSSSSLSPELLSARTVARVAAQDASIAPFVTLAAPPAWHTKEELQQQRGSNPRVPPPPPPQPPNVAAPYDQPKQNQFNNYIKQQEQELQLQTNELEQNVRLAQLELAVHRAQLELSRAQAEASRQQQVNNNTNNNPAVNDTPSSIPALPRLAQAQQVQQQQQQQPVYNNSRPSESSPMRQPRMVSTGIYLKDGASPSAQPSRPSAFASSSLPPAPSQQMTVYPSTVAMPSPTAQYSSPSPWSNATSASSSPFPAQTMSPVTVAPVPSSPAYSETTEDADLNPDDPTVLSTHGHGAVRVLSAIGKVHWAIRLYAVLERSLGILLSIIGAAAAADVFNSIIAPLIQVFVLNPLTQFFLTKTKVEHMRIGGRRLRWKKTFTMQEFWWRKLVNNISFLATGGFGCCSNSWFNAWVDSQMEWEATGIKEELFLPHTAASTKLGAHAASSDPAEEWPFIWTDALPYWSCCGCCDCTKQMLPFEDKAPCCDCHPLYQLERQLTAFQFGSRRVIFSSDRDEFDREFATLRQLNLLLTIISLGSWDGSMLNDRMCVWIDKNAKITIDADDGWFGPAQLDEEDMKDGFSKLSVVSGLGQAAAGAKGKYTSLISQAANIAQRVF